MAIVSQGNSVVLDVDATSAIWVKSTGNAEVTVNRGGTPEVSNVTTDVGRFGYYGEPFQLTIRSVSGQVEYQDQQFSIQPLTSTQMGGLADSSATDVALAVNGLIDVVNLPQMKYAPIPQATSLDAGGIAYTVASGSPTITNAIAPNGQPALKIEFSAFCQVEFPSLVNAPYDGHMFIQIYGSQTLTNLATCRIRAFQAGAEANYRQGERTAISNAFNSPYDVGDTPITWHFSSVNTTSVGAPPATFVASRYQLNLNPQAGQTATLYVFAVGVGQPRKSRICVVYDDSYDSAFKLGYQPFNSRGIKTTTAVIANTVGKTNYASLQTIQAYLAGGNALVAHGTSLPDGSGNLFSAHNDSYAEAFEDIQYNVDYLRRNNLLRQYADRCYIFPQGRWEKTANENTLLELMIDAGFQVGRSALVGGAEWCYSMDSMTKQQRLTMPIIGHLWAGTTTAEATNISNIVSRIQAVAAANGVDAFLMLHIVQPTSTADGSMSSIGIRVSDLNTLAAAIKTEVDAGRLEAVTMPELVGGISFWNNN